MEKIPEIVLYVPRRNSRVQYVLEVIFRYVLGMGILWVEQKEDFISHAGRKLYYGNGSMSGPSLNIPDSEAWHGAKYAWPKPYFTEVDGLPYWEWGDGKAGIDPLPMLFFLLSRMEEYPDGPRDPHGRFSAASSVTHQASLLRFPIVDAWAEWFRKRLNQAFPMLPPIPKPDYHYQPTYDIDHVRAYLWKGWARSIGAAAKDALQGKYATLLNRVATWLGRKPDPYDCFGYFDELHQEWGLKPIYFWLLGDYGPQDKNPHWQHPKFQAAIRAVGRQAGAKMGIHPSYDCWGHPEKILGESQRLSQILSQQVSRSRFHFLRFRLPESYRALLEAGIREDYSMAYPDALGFRAGTSHVFPWYDLEREEVTPLMLHPFCLMDVTLKDYLGLPPKEALAECREIIQQVAEYGGTLTTLWHNSSLWNGWDGVYDELVAAAQDGLKLSS